MDRDRVGAPAFYHWGGGWAAKVADEKLAWIYYKGVYQFEQRTRDLEKFGQMLAEMTRAGADATPRSPDLDRWRKLFGLKK